MRRATRPAAGHPRGGFTLVELLVAAALSLVVMTVLSLAFQTGLQTLSNLKSVVGLAEQMRAAEGVIRRDLAADHLVDAQDQPVRLSRMTGVGERGYFRFVQGESLAGAAGGEGPAPVQEGLAENGLASFRTPSAKATTFGNNQSGRAWGDHFAFTARLDGTGPQKAYAASLGPDTATAQANLALLAGAGLTRPELQAADPTGTLFVSRWAEVAYFLVPSGTRGNQPAKVFSSDEGMPAGSATFPLYTLYRRQRALAPQTPNPPITLTGTLPGLAMSGASPIGVNDIASTANRIGNTNDPVAAAATAGGQLALISSLPNSTGPDPNAIRNEQQGRPHPVPNLTATANEFGSDVLLNNVVSMTVRPVFGHRVPQAVLDHIRANGIASPAVITAPDGATVIDNGELVSYAPRDLLFPNVVFGSGAGGYGDRTQFPRFFDVGGSGFSGTFQVNGANLTTPSPITNFRVKALEIKLRVYDQKNKTTRQMTILQDL